MMLLQENPPQKTQKNITSGIEHSYVIVKGMTRLFNTFQWVWMMDEVKNIFINLLINVCLYLKYFQFLVLLLFPIGEELFSFTILTSSKWLKPQWNCHQMIFMACVALNTYIELTIFHKKCYQFSSEMFLILYHSEVLQL